MNDHWSESIEWDIQNLDLDAYLERVGVDHVSADARGLRALHRAHIARIPFENLDVFLRRPLALELDALQEKLVGSERGGYCYEHGLLFAAALERVGFPVQRLLARVGGVQDRPRPRTHMALLVRIGARPWLADVGFGSGLTEPVPLLPGAFSQGDWHYQLDETPGGGWLLSELLGSQRRPMYLLELDRQHFADIVMANHYTQTWPTSPFLRSAVVVGKDDHRIVRLHNRILSTTLPDGQVSERLVAWEDYRDVLGELGVALTARDLESVQSRLRSIESNRPV